MDSRAAIKVGLDTAEFVAMGYLNDLTDAEFMLRPHQACNHINWQIGHLIEGEHRMMETIYPQSMPALPTGFKEKYSRDMVNENDPSKFCTKAELMSAYRQQREASLALLAKQQDSDLDRETGVPYAPTFASMFSLLGSHWLMHSGQWVIVRRQLGKSALF